MHHGSIEKPDTSAAPRASAGTARFIARSLLIASYQPEYARLLSAESAGLNRQLLLAAADRRFVWAATNSVFRAVARAASEIALPGITPHYLARKRCLEAWVRDASGTSTDACRQVVVLGAGLDTLGWRLHRESAGLNIFEIDRPAALRVKALAMTGDWARRENLTFLAADLTQESLAEALARAAAYDASASTLFLAEGLLMYLRPERVSSLLREIAGLGRTGQPTFFAFTFMEARADGRIGFRRSNPMVDWWLRWQGEPFRWALDPEKVAGFLDQNGWLLCDLASSATLNARYLEPAGLAGTSQAAGEWLALARTKEAA